MWWLWALLVFIIVYHVVFTKKYKVYGTMTCGWTRKQLDYYGSRARFVDCDNGDCPDGFKSFPVIEKPSGERHVGFSTDF